MVGSTGRALPPLLLLQLLLLFQLLPLHFLHLCLVHLCLSHHYLQCLPVPCLSCWLPQACRCLQCMPPVPIQRAWERVIWAGGRRRFIRWGDRRWTWHGEQAQANDVHLQMGVRVQPGSCSGSSSVLQVNCLHPNCSTFSEYGLDLCLCDVDTVWINGGWLMLCCFALLLPWGALHIQVRIERTHGRLPASLPSCHT